MLSFMVSNNLVVNPEKTGIMITGKSSDLTTHVQVGNADIEEKQSHQLLGMRMSADLTWKDHVEAVASSIQSGIFAIRRLKESVSQQSLIRVRDALVNSKIRFGLAAYGKSLHEE